MPSYSADETGRRALLAGVALGVACVILFLVTRQREDRTRGLLSDELTAKARSAVVLLDEAHLVCLDTAASILEHRRKLSKRKDENGKTVSASTWEHSVPAGASEDLAFGRELIKEAVALTGSARRASLRMGPRLDRLPIVIELKHLADSTRVLCSEASGGARRLDEYEASVTARVRLYKVALARIGRPYLVSEGERIGLLKQLEPRLAESRRTASQATAALVDDASDWVPPEGPEVAPKSPQQLRTERRNLMAEEEWRQRQTEQRENLHREAIGRWRGETQPTRRAMPTLGLEEVDRQSLTGQVSEMRSWVEVHRRESGPVTVALRRFDMVRRIETDERTSRACRALFAKVTDLLQIRKLFSSPIDGLNSLLLEAYTEAQRAAESCLAGDMEASNSHFDRAEKLFVKIHTEYGLTSN